MNEKILSHIRQKVSQNINEKRKLKSATVEINTTCNFRCIHCYNQDLKPCIMNLELFKKVINQLVLNGCQVVTLTGGEILLHPNFAEMYKYCFSKGLRVTLFTNGYFIDKYLDLLNNHKPKKIEISLYGSSNEIYKKICGIADGFDVVYRNVCLVLENKLNLVLKTIVMEQNVLDFQNIQSLCYKIGVPFKFDINILKSKNFTNDQTQQRLCRHYKSFMDTIAQYRLNNWKTYEKKYEEIKENGLLYKCYAGRKNLFISAHGGVRICNFAEFSEKSLLDMELSEIWKSFEKFVNLKEDKNSECYKCKYKVYCSNCPVSTYMDKGTDGTTVLPVEQNCRGAKYIFDAVTKNVNK